MTLQSCTEFQEFLNFDLPTKRKTGSDQPAGFFFVIIFNAFSSSPHRKGPLFKTLNFLTQHLVE